MSVVSVNRSIGPVYPEWVQKVMHPELENSGPTHYDLEIDVKQWLHEDQKKDYGYIKGEAIYEVLKETGMLESCLSLRDIEEIQKKGPSVFRRFFRGRSIFAWRSVVEDYKGRLYVPYLYYDDGKIILDWDRIESDWLKLSPALVFRKKSSS